MKRSAWCFAVYVLMSALWAHALPSSSGIVAAARVRLRAGPSISDAIVKELALGTIGSILDATTDRERIVSTREFSYCWYRIELADGAQGWIYGQYFYPLEREEPDLISIGEVEYRLAVFREDGYLNDLPSQDQYALPCLIREEDGRACVFSIDAVVYHQLPSYLETSGRRTALPGSTFLLVSNDGMSEEVESVGIAMAGDLEILEVKVVFSLQAGGGTYTLAIIPPATAGDSFTAGGVEDVELWSGV